MARNPEGSAGKSRNISSKRHQEEINIQDRDLKDSEEPSIGEEICGRD